MRTATWPDFSRVDAKDLPLQLTRLVLELRAELDDVRRNALAPLKTSKDVFNSSTPRTTTPKLGYVHEVHPENGDVIINLPKPSSAEAWGALGFVRPVSSNTITIVAPPGTLVSNVASVNLATTHGIQFFWWTGQNWQWERG